MSVPHPGDPRTVTADGFVLSPAGDAIQPHGSWTKLLIPLAGQPLVATRFTIPGPQGLEARIAGAKSNLSFFAPTVPDKPSQSGLGPLSGISFCACLIKGPPSTQCFSRIDLPAAARALDRLSSSSRFGYRVCDHYRFR